MFRNGPKARTPGGTLSFKVTSESLDSNSTLSSLEDLHTDSETLGSGTVWSSVSGVRISLYPRIDTAQYLGSEFPLSQLGQARRGSRCGLRLLDEYHVYLS